MKTPRVLIIDDEPMISELLDHQLSGKGCAVLRAHTGEAGLEIMRNNPVDLVVTDFMMPILNGMEFTRILKSRPEWANIRVIFMSANTGAEYSQQALSLGALDYLPKSLGAAAIAAKVLEHVGLASVDPPAVRSSESGAHVARRLQRVELLAEHLIEVLELTGMDTQLSAPAARALILARSKAEEIRATAAGEGADTVEGRVGKAAA